MDRVHNYKGPMNIGALKAKVLRSETHFFRKNNLPTRTPSMTSKGHEKTSASRLWARVKSHWVAWTSGAAVISAAGIASAFLFRNEKQFKQLAYAKRRH